jgi:hypothetical protein
MQAENEVNLLRYMIHLATWEKLPIMPRMYSVEYDARLLDRDTQTLMKMSHVRCPQGLELLKQRHRVNNATTLITLLPSRKRKRQPMRKLMSVMRHLTGTLPYDPMKQIARQHMRAGCR